MFKVPNKYRNTSDHQITDHQMGLLLKKVYHQIGVCNYSAADCADWVKEEYGVTLSSRQVAWILRRLDVCVTDIKHHNRLIYELPALKAHITRD